MSNGNFSQFLESLGAFESGINPSQSYTSDYLNFLGVYDPSRGNAEAGTSLPELQYHVHNTLGFLGKYQFGEALLIDLGYYTPASTGYYGSTPTNEWCGTFTGKDGATSKEAFMSTVQESTIREAFSMNMRIIDQYLAAAGKTIDDFLGTQIAYTYKGPDGLMHNDVATVTLSGILASAHLQGPGGVASLLLNGAQAHDEYGTNIVLYMDKFGGYDTPFGTNGNDIMSGSDYNETLIGGAGDDAYITGGGNDVIKITQNAGSRDIVTDFDIHHDVIDLSSFSGLDFSAISISTNARNDAVITLKDDQTLTLQGVCAPDVTDALFVFSNTPKDPTDTDGNTEGTGDGDVFSFTWAWGTNNVVENFDPSHDVIDLQNFWFSYSHIDLMDQGDNTVISISENNQLITLEHVQLSDLSAKNFIGITGDFSAALS